MARRHQQDELLGQIFLFLFSGESCPLTPSAGKHNLVAVGIFAHGEMGWFAVLGLGFLVAFSACGHDFGGSGDHVRYLEGEAGPGFSAFASAMDGDESIGEIDLGDVRILPHDGSAEAILVKTGRAFRVRRPDRVFEFFDVHGVLLGSPAVEHELKNGLGLSPELGKLKNLTTQNYLSDVGAFSESESFYGAFDLNGNVYQWNDLDGTAAASRGLIGGFWFGGPASATSTTLASQAATYEGNDTGFRLAAPIVEMGVLGRGAAVPEPSVMVLVALASSALLISNRRKRADSDWN